MPRIDTALEPFYHRTFGQTPTYPDLPVTTGREVWDMRLPYLMLDVPFTVPYEAMLAEARAARHRFIEHKSNKYHGHIGWLTMSIIEDNEPTEEAPFCPLTTEFFMKSFGFDHLYQVRYTLLAPGGQIMPHVDKAYERTVNFPYEFSAQRHLNISLNQPAGCDFVIKNGGVIPMYEGCVVALTTANAHAVWNRSDVERYHILVHGGCGEEAHWPQTLLRSYRGLHTRTA